jgi:hypothetical protein
MPLPPVDINRTVCKVFTYPAIMMSSDCVNEWPIHGCVMAIKPHLPLEERLSALRGADQFRNWTSLDDKRVCILCDRSFTGRQVEITRSRSGRVDLHCPTDGCTADPSHWVYPGNPLVSETVYKDWSRALHTATSEGIRAAISPRNRRYRYA